MNENNAPKPSVWLSVGVTVAVVAAWALLAVAKVFPPSAFPSPWEVVRTFGGEVRSGTLFNDIVASLFRVSVGFLLSAAIGIPLGLWMGLYEPVRSGLLPLLNYLRALSPLAWIPFAILWFGVGDSSAIFLICMAAVFPLALATLAGVANIPRVYFRASRDYGLTGRKLLTEVTLPAILPQIITALRVVAGLCWLVVVAAEMIAGRDGLGYLIWDARNGLRMDRLVVGMIVIGVLGVLIDRVLLQLTRLPSVRWGYER
ncbi:MAG: ABC transporter permease [Armatimonadaceae bacterium]